MRKDKRNRCLFAVLICISWEVSRADKRLSDTEIDASKLLGNRLNRIICIATS